MPLKQTPYGLKGPSFKDLKGKIFDKLTVVDYAGYNETYKISKWLCKCFCGVEVIRMASTLTRFKNQHSCGCMGTCPVKPNNQHAFKRMLSTYKQNALKRGYKFLLSVDEFRIFISQNCYYCDSNPVTRFDNCTVDPILANGIDRRDNDLDYTIENCVSCCKSCNRAKGQMSEKEFLDWISKVYYFNKRNR